MKSKAISVAFIILGFLALLEAFTKYGNVNVIENPDKLLDIIAGITIIVAGLSINTKHSERVFVFAVLMSGVFLICRYYLQFRNAAWSQNPFKHVTLLAGIILLLIGFIELYAVHSVKK